MTTLRQHLRVLGQTFEVSAPVGTSLAEILEAIPQARTQEWQVEGNECRGDSILGETPLLDGVELTPRHVAKAESALRLVVTSGPQLGYTWLLTPGTHDIGRGHPLVSGDPLVSRQHAVIALQRGEVTLMDVGSANGILLCGEPLKPHTPTPWRLGEYVNLGGSEILLNLDVPDTPLPPAVLGHFPRPAQAVISPLTPLTVEWPTPPPPQGRHPLRLIATLLPLPVGLAAAYFFHSMMLLLMMAASPLIMLFTALDDRRQGKRHSHAQRAQREALLLRHARGMQHQLALERDYRRTRLISADELRQAASGRSRGLDTASAHWPLDLRLGVGRCRSSSYVRLEDSSPFYPMLQPIPISCSIAPHTLTHLMCHSDIRDRVLAQITSELIVHGAPGTRPPCIASRTLACRDDDRSDLIVKPNVQDVIAAFVEEQPGGQQTGVLIIEQDEALTAQQLDDLTRTGFAVVWVGARCPGATQQEFLLAEGYQASSGPQESIFSADLPGLDWLDDVMAASRRWQPRAYPFSTKSALPDRLTPGELGLKAEALWTDSANMDVPIGLDVHGLRTLNLEKYGPHALVAGTTGSGKSEFLLAYLRGLLALNSPQHVTAILIDYKGGATFGPLACAPHIVGVICDLDVGLAERALIGLRAEIHRREKLLRDHGVASFGAYHGLTDPKAPLPRLFVVVDEFRVLAEELPDFVSGLVRIAAVGRSLGIHLILATQRPGGVVTADMRANIDLRVCLRVRERADSIDVLESPLAAHIDRMTPGRAYIAVAGEAPCEVQTMYTSCGTGFETSTLHIHPIATAGNCAPVPLHECPGCAPQHLTATTDLEQSVEAYTRAAARLAAPHRPVLPALADHIDITTTTTKLDWVELIQAHCTVASLESDDDVIALVDLPELQAQPGLVAEHSCHVSICGSAKTGRSNAARAIATALEPTTSNTWWVTPDDECAENVIRPDDVQAVANMMDDLMAGRAPRLLVVDGWEQLYETLLLLNHGMAADDFMGLISRAHRLPMQIIITGGRTLMTSKISTLFEMRFIMRQNDFGEYSLAGLRPQHVPAAMPAGRALVLPHGRQVQFVECPPPVTSTGRRQAQIAEREGLQ